MSPYHKQATSRQRWQVPAHQRTQAPPHLIPGHSLTDRPAHHEADARRLVLFAAADEQVPGQQLAARPAAAPDGHGELGRPTHAGLCRKHSQPPRLPRDAPWSDADPGPALLTPCGQDGAARAGPHTQPEAMRLGTASIVRLERALAHWWLQIRCLHPQSATRHAKARRIAQAGLPRESLSLFTVRAARTTGQTGGLYRQHGPSEAPATAGPGGPHPERPFTYRPR